MAALEESLGKAIRARNAEHRDRQLRARWILAALGSYLSDVVFLGLYAVAGTVPAVLPLWYGLSSVLVSALFYTAVVRGWTRGMRDPGVVAWQSFAGLLLQLAVVLHAPQIAFPYLANLFTVFAFGMLWIPLAHSIALWALGAALTGAFLYARAPVVALPLASPAELAITWLYFSLVLGRCVFLSSYAAAMRARLADSRRRLAEAMEQVKQLVSCDELTGSLNRRALMERLEQEAGRTARTGESFTLVLLDLDRFKSINDTYGHAAGDEVLRRFAGVVHDTMRDTDVFGRYGGEEFMMILTGTGPRPAFAAVERVCAAVRDADWSFLPGGSVTVSAGVAGYRPPETPSQLIARADAALYRAKHQGRDRVCES